MTDLTVLNEQFESAYPQEVLRWAAQNFGEKLAVVTSFQPTGIVILDMLMSVAPETTVLTLDTGLLFPETYTLMDTLERRFGLRLVRIHPELSVHEQNQVYGSNLWDVSPDQCCHLRKVVPLGQALTDYDAWISGLRRDQSPNRRETPIISWDKRNQKIKLSPLATWTEAMVWSYIHSHELPYNALHDRHYPTIGCYPCTQPVANETGDLRAGRWVGHRKTECGIHLSTINN